MILEKFINHNYVKLKIPKKAKYPKYAPYVPDEVRCKKGESKSKYNAVMPSFKIPKASDTAIDFAGDEANIIAEGMDLII